MRHGTLRCTACGREYRLERANPRCDDCGEPLEVRMTTSASIAPARLGQTMLERYADFYPFEELDNDLSLGEGFTPLTQSTSLSSELDLGAVYIKNETMNPTWSFKDRGTVTALQHATRMGYRRIGTVSSGNMAASVAAYGARAGLETFVLVSTEMPEEKLHPVSIYGAHLIRVEGDYGELYFKSLEVGAANDIYFMNSDVPFRVEGSKTIAFEICEELDFTVPDYVIVPTSAGGNIRGIIKGFREFQAAGLVDRMPVVVCAQAAGCSPIATAVRSRAPRIERVQAPDTMAHAIANPFPPSGNEVLRQLEDIGGIAVTVSEGAIVDAQARLAHEGIFGQPASAVPLAALRKVRGEGTIEQGSSVALVVTGGGLKYTAAFEKHHLQSYSCRLDQLAEFVTAEFEG